MLGELVVAAKPDCWISTPHKFSFSHLDQVHRCECQSRICGRSPLIYAHCQYRAFPLELWRIVANKLVSNAISSK